MIIFGHEREWFGGHHLLHHNDDHHEESGIVNEQTENEDDQHFEHETHSTMRAIILVSAISLHVSVI